jgi:hypothetical protein
LWRTLAVVVARQPSLRQHLDALGYPVTESGVDTDQDDLVAALQTGE